MTDNDGSGAWLRREALPRDGEAGALRQEWRKRCADMVLVRACSSDEARAVRGASPAALAAHGPGGQGIDGPLGHALDELRKGLRSLLGLRARIGLAMAAGPGRSRGPEGTTDAVPPAGSGVRAHHQWQTADEAFGFLTLDDGALVLWSPTDEGLLHGAFHLLAACADRRHPDTLPARSEPAQALRMLDHWDNLDGSIERGYAGRSLFFDRGRLRLEPRDRLRLGHYARLLASVGINAVAINNVNVHDAETRLMLDPLLGQVARVAQIFRSWGIRTFLSINFAAPLSLGLLDTADPLDTRVAAFWEARAREIWKAIPDFGGFLVKADSEGRHGPFTYGRTHAEGANMLGRAVAPWGGIVLWRCFVYNCRQDWRDRKTDRARAAWDHFMPLDGTFLDNVALQIKNGPMDFQVREPVSPLILGLARTNQVLELQVTQEYTGQQRHVCNLLPQWKEVLDFPVRGDSLKLADLSSGKARHRPLGGMAAVANTGDSDNWTGHHLAQLNLYGYGRLAWDPGQDPADLTRQWIHLSFGHDPEVEKVLLPLLLDSWKVYESYTSPLGLGWMVNPDHHYGPNVNGYEYSRWGTYHFADRRGIGVDRTRATGTGYTGQYPEPWRSIYEDPRTCPDELKLFFHHLTWRHRLTSGTTVIQHIYDRHFEGLEAALANLESWRSLQGRVDRRRYQEVLARLQEQAASAREWCDQVNTYCWRMSGIADRKGRTIWP